MNANLSSNEKIVSDIGIQYPIKHVSCGLMASISSSALAPLDDADSADAAPPRVGDEVGTKP